MDCTEVRELLSAFYDGELTSEERAAVLQHLDRCPDCVGELEGFRSLTAMAHDLTHAQPSAQLWKQLEERLDVEPSARSAWPTLREWLGWTRRPAVRLGLAAAAVLIAVGLFGYIARYEFGDGSGMAAVFGQYLDEFQRDPHTAQHLLLAEYQGEGVDAEQAVRTAGFRPAVADGMPNGYAVESTYVMKMPCCTCVQCLCKRSDGTTIAIFEHDDEDPHSWFGGRPGISAVCNGTPCSLVELDGRIAASWRHGRRHITAIGVRDTVELGQLVAWFDTRR